MLSSELLSSVPSLIPKKQDPTNIEGVIEFHIKCDYLDDGVRVVESDLDILK